MKIGSWKDRKSFLPLNKNIFHGFVSMKWKKTLPNINSITRFNGTNYDYSAKISNLKTIIVSLITMSNRRTISLFKKFKILICLKTESSILIKFLTTLQNKLLILFLLLSLVLTPVASRNSPNKELQVLTFWKIIKKRK